MVHLTIDDKSIEISADRTLLEACREHGIHIPTLCYHPALEPFGACRLCMVEVSQPSLLSRLVAACIHPCEEGLVVYTNSEAVQRSRRITAELLLAGSYNSSEMWALAEELGVREVRYTIPEADNCILCGLCVRACNEIVGVSAISLSYRGSSKKVSTPFDVSSAVCIGCGTCVLICPTGRFSLDEVSRFRGFHTSHSPYHRQYCQVCDETNLKRYFVQNIAELDEKGE
jgi:NADH dehydrogenase/NADH:ubiquinone oxidoreductase subunit G